MRHNKKRGMKLGTDASHTKAMKKSLIRALFENDRIKTLDQRAKAVRGDVDKVITWAKKGDIASRRLAIAKVGDKELVREVFEKAAQGMWADRNGGYTRIMKLGPRKGDAAEVVILELVTEPDLRTPEEVDALRAIAARDGREIFFMSADQGEGVEELLAAMWSLRAEMEAHAPLLHYQEMVLEDEEFPDIEVVYTRETD